MKPASSEGAGIFVFESVMSDSSISPGMGLLFTIFTPTFNRRETLPRVYQSLLAQDLSREGFEWLVVDDGSSDGTGALFDEWIQKAPFPIRYLWQPNGGKHRAWNRGVQEARGELFVCVDSDDSIPANALSTLESIWSRIPESKRAEVAGILARCQDPEGKALGPLFPVPEATFDELVFRYGWHVDSLQAVRLSLLRSNPFPPGPASLLVPEGTLWHKISGNFPWVLTSTPLLTYYSGVYGRTDQLSRSHALPIGLQAPGMALALESVLDNSFSYFRVSPLAFVRASVHFSRFLFHTEGRAMPRILRLKRAGARALCLGTLPLGSGVFLLDLLRGRV